MKEVWMPKLIEIEYLKHHGTPEEQEYYSQFGFEQLEIPEECTYVVARMQQLIERFNERFAFRMLGQETMERWQIRLQNRMDEIVVEYNRAYKLYADNAADLMTDIHQGEKTTIIGESQASGNDSERNESQNRYVDTPDSHINAQDNYADSLNKTNTERNTYYGRKDNVDNEVTRRVTGVLLENINATVKDWKDIDTEFVKDFENLFLNIFW